MDPTQGHVAVVDTRNGGDAYGIPESWPAHFASPDAQTA